MAKRVKKKRKKSSDSKHEPPLPDTTKWQPRKQASETLESAFAKRCLAAEKLIRLKGKLEKQMNIDNYDSGMGLEDIVRNELRAILPTRYTVTSGVINEPQGRTAGDFDVIIFNELWFPQIKAGATPQSRRVHFPIDGVYAIGEIKQTLDLKTLDGAMEKLVSCHRLKRRRTCAYRVVENREGSPCVHGLTNPLYSFILATDLRDGVTLDEVVERFFYINQDLKRLEVVRALCVLGHGAVIWGFLDPETGEGREALFMLEDLYEPIFPAYTKVLDADSAALYPFIVNLMLHLYHSILAPEDVAALYGSSKGLNRMRPKSADVVHPPDKEWLDALSVKCNEDHEKVLELQGVG